MEKDGWMDGGRNGKRQGQTDGRRDEGRDGGWKNTVRMGTTTGEEESVTGGQNTGWNATGAGTMHMGLSTV